MDEQTATPVETAPDAQTVENAPTAENASTAETAENAPTTETQTTQPPRNEGVKWRVKQHHYQHQKNHLSSLG